MADAPRASEHDVTQRYARHVNPSFIKLLGMLGYGRVWTRAEGCHLIDHEGRRYLDFLSGFGSVNVGHHHPRLRARIERLLDEQPLCFCHIGPGRESAALAESLASRAPGELSVSLFASSGSEAVEAAMKLARVVTRRSGFVSTTLGFHGTNFGSLSLMGPSRMRKPFEPLLSGVRQVPFGDVAALETALKPKDVAAFVVEPVLGEGGVLVPPVGYLRAVADLCRKKGTLLVLDEVQTGLGRTGAWFACEHEGVVPDVLVLAKALSGGMAPISAAITTEALWQKAYGPTDRFDLHSSTFEGNALSCAVAHETLAIIEDEDLVTNAAARGAQLLAGLRERLLGHPLVVDVRGRGLLVGVELGPTDQGLLNKVLPGVTRAVSQQMFGQWAAVCLLERGIVCQPASHQWNVLRFEPPLSIGAEDVDHVVDAVGDLLDGYRSLSTLVADVSKRFSSQWRDGWAF